MNGCCGAAGPGSGIAFLISTGLQQADGININEGREVFGWNILRSGLCFGGGLHVPVWYLGTKEHGTTDMVEIGDSAEARGATFCTPGAAM